MILADAPLDDLFVQDAHHDDHAHELLDELGIKQVKHNALRLTLPEFLDELCVHLCSQCMSSESVVDVKIMVKAFLICCVHHLIYLFY